MISFLVSQVLTFQITNDDAEDDDDDDEESVASIEIITEGNLDDFQDNGELEHTEVETNEWTEQSQTQSFGSNNNNNSNNMSFNNNMNSQQGFQNHGHNMNWNNSFNPMLAMQMMQNGNWGFPNMMGSYTDDTSDQSNIFFRNEFHGHARNVWHGHARHGNGL